MPDKFSILLVEDDDVDAMTVERALKELRLVNPLHRVMDGEEALSFLRNGKNKKPGLILLDLNMPKMNGFEFLKAAKADPDLRSIPVVVLTTSKEQQGTDEAFKSGIAGYMLKPVDYLRFVDVVKAINMYWSLSEFPH